MKRNTFVSFLILLFIVSIFMLFSSCTPQQRLNRLLKNHPELRTKDTIIVLDTIIINESKFDTVFRVTNKLDTFYITNERIKLQIIKNDSIIKVNYLLPTDTIIKQVPVITNRIKEVIIKETYNKFYWFGAGIITMLLLLFGIKKMT